MTTLNDLDAIGGVSAKLWVSGETVTQWDYRKSPLDGEVYQRRTASGSGTTDPADDVTNYVAKSFNRISAIPAVAIGPTVANGTASNWFAIGALKPTLPAAATGVRTLALSLTGRGRLGFLGLYKTPAGTQNIRVEILVDGRGVYDFVVSYTGANNECAVFVGNVAATISGATTFPIALAQPDHIGLVFKRTLQVYVTANTGTLVATDFLPYVLKTEA